MPDEKAGGHISQLMLNNGDSLEIAKNDIVVFVGPNNAGKSQSLKDIYTLSEQKKPTVVISDISITKSKAPISKALAEITTGINNGNRISYYILGKHMNIWADSDKEFPTEQYYGEYRDFFVANLDTSARLTICNPPESITRQESKVHPIHYAAFDSKYRRWLSDSFKKAFGVEITPNTQYGSRIPLCIGKPVQLSGEYEDEQSRLEEYVYFSENIWQKQL